MRQIRRDLAILQDNNLIQIVYLNCKRYIFIPKEQIEKYLIPIFDFVNQRLTASEIIIASVLTDKAAFYARAGLGALSLNDNEASSLPSFLNLSIKTVKNALNKLKSLNLINYFNEDLKNKVLRAFYLEKEFSNLYSKLVNLQLSQKCASIVQKRALKKVMENADHECQQNLEKANSNILSQQNKKTLLSSVWRSILTKSGLTPENKYAPFILTLKQMITVLFKSKFSSFPQKNFLTQNSMEKNGLIHNQNNKYLSGKKWSPL